MKSFIILPLLCMSTIGAQAQLFFQGTFYEHCDNYLGGGSSAGQQGVVYNTTVGNFSTLNDNVSQLAFTAGFTVTLYNGVGSNSFQSDYRDFTSSDACLIDDGFNDVASSYRITVNATGNNVATLYRSIDYITNVQGYYGISLPVGNYTLAQLQAYGIFNDDVSSLTVRPGYYIRLYAGDNFSALHPIKVYTKSRANLVSDNFNDITSSIEIGQLDQYGNVPPPIVVTLYPDCQNNSGAIYLRQGDYTAAQLTAMGLPNNSLSKCKIAPGYAIESYDGDNFNNIILYLANIYNYEEETCIASSSPTSNDKTSSVRVIKRYNTTNAPFNLSDKLQLNSEISIYPNPAHDKITVKGLKGNNLIAIYNGVGQQVLNKTTAESQINIDISALAKGFYHVEIVETTSNTKSVSKIIKN